MFENANLWEAGILLIGVAFVIGAVYLAVLLKRLAKTIEDANAIITDNRVAIQQIMSEVESITRNSSVVVEDVQESVGSIKNSIVNVEKTVKTSKNVVLSPMLKAVSTTQAFMRVLDKRSKRKKK